MPVPPVSAPSGAPPPPALRKFTLHPPSLTAASSPVTIAANGAGPLSPASLSQIRISLVTARAQAAERLAIRDSNRRNLAERQTNEKRVAEEQARAKEVERRRKREEDERREKERVERVEKERAEREKEEALTRQREEAAYQKQKAQEEEEKRVKDELEKQAALQRAREATEKKRQEELLAAVKVERATSTPAPLQDVKMEDGVAVSANVTADGRLNLATNDSVPSINVMSSPEPEEDVGQPKPPSRHDKKKRKRDNVIDSDVSSSDDDQPLLVKARKLESQTATSGPSPSPTPQPNGTRASPVPVAVEPETADYIDPLASLTPVERKLKEEKFIKHSIPIRPPAPGTATAFYLPSQNLVPPKPVSIPAAPTPKRQADVRGDFSIAKPGAQIAHHTFNTWVEAFLRPYGEDDLAFLAPKPDDVSPYILPNLGKHYTERWEEEDSGLPVASTSQYASPLEPPPLTRTRPIHLNEDTLGSEHVFLGPLSERLVAAMEFHEPGKEGDDDDSDDELSAKMEVGDGDAARIAAHMSLDAVDLEDRIMRELRFIGVLPEEDVDWSTREDDEISSALRACQRELHHQTALNEARKVILTSIVKDRMAYQDYETTRDAQERIIEAGWNKRQRAGKKKTKGKEREKGEGGKAPISMALLEAMTKRNRLVSHFRPFFEDEEDQGRYYGIPENSVYEGLEEMLQEEEEQEGIGLP